MFDSPFPQPHSRSFLVFLLVCNPLLLTPCIMFFSQHMSIPSQPVLLYYQCCVISAHLFLISVQFNQCRIHVCCSLVIIGSASVVCIAESVKWYSVCLSIPLLEVCCCGLGGQEILTYCVCLSVCPNMGPQQQTRCWRFAAAGWRYRSIAAAAAGK